MCFDRFDECDDDAQHKTFGVLAVFFFIWTSLDHESFKKIQKDFPSQRNNRLSDNLFFPVLLKKIMKIYFGKYLQMRQLAF